MRVSEKYNLGRTQPTLEFVDVDIRGDTRVNIDPRAIQGIESTWSAECVALLQSFFSTVLDAIRTGKHARARHLLSTLREPNETHLGLSRGEAQGRGMGRDLARSTWDALRSSRAVSSGLLEDLEDTILFIEGIGPDIVSDITTNIIRGPLIAFTTDVCNYYGIDLTPGIASGQIWDHRTRRWTNSFVALPRTEFGPLILVPKAIVRRVPTYEPGEYYKDFILPYLQQEELNAPASSLVEILRSGHRRVTKKSVREKYGQGKAVNLSVTERNEELLAQYRQSKVGRQSGLPHSTVSALTETPEVDWDALLNAVLACPSGRDHATQYHHAVETLLSALFYPALDFPQRESKIHAGRKRIDITYTNTATSGFFSWIRDQHRLPCSFVPVECKNYGQEIGNPEFDQLGMRMSPTRGQLGFLCHRGFNDKKQTMQTCKDAAADMHGYMIPLDDEDLVALVAERKRLPDRITFPLLRERFRQLL